MEAGSRWGCGFPEARRRDEIGSGGLGRSARRATGETPGADRVGAAVAERSAALSEPARQWLEVSIEAPVWLRSDLQSCGVLEAVHLARSAFAPQASLGWLLLSWLLEVAERVCTPEGGGRGEDRLWGFFELLAVLHVPAAVRDALTGAHRTVSSNALRFLQQWIRVSVGDGTLDTCRCWWMDHVGTDPDAALDLIRVLRGARLATLTISDSDADAGEPEEDALALGMDVLDTGSDGDNDEPSADLGELLADADIAEALLTLLARASADMALRRDASDTLWQVLLVMYPYLDVMQEAQLLTSLLRRVLEWLPQSLPEDADATPLDVVPLLHAATVLALDEDLEVEAETLTLIRERCRELCDAAEGADVSAARRQVMSTVHLLLQVADRTSQPMSSTAV
ncbi:hypothetical protein CDCA_CDCA05G1550 [Cyanidium caldarium]|uniref:Uncharacterized protein n=1 Tax=Cyanidium caldarium TaxID=2771 RepID=A0AAV9ITU6_CYACA|nr:hypothetical protein CDCA_CDCA05G1550 [Cyanidium caldarium]